jgi:hypothetical protein
MGCREMKLKQRLSAPSLDSNASVLVNFLACSSNTTTTSSTLQNALEVNRHEKDGTSISDPTEARRSKP